MIKFQIFINRLFLILGAITLLSCQAKAQNELGAAQQIDLSGTWGFRVDSLDIGISRQWFKQSLTDQLTLPGSMTTNGKGDDISINTPWTGSIVDSSWFYKPEYEPYRKQGNIKLPFWLQPAKYYKGAAWYQKMVVIPTAWKGKRLELFIERSHWESTVWIDDKAIGMENSLSTPHIFYLPRSLSPGAHRITIRVDNRVKAIDPGQNSHSISDHTQTNWNGMIGKLLLIARPTLLIEAVQLYPDIKKKQVTAHVRINNSFAGLKDATIQLMATSNNAKAVQLKSFTKYVTLKQDITELEMVYPMGDDPLLWDEFNPQLYSLKIQLKAINQADEKVIAFGMREFATRGTQFTINGRLTFLRGTLECAVFPITGYPSTDLSSWLHIFKMARSYGLNHFRFHSWCPPEAAFTAADQSGFYLQVECGSWANSGATIGDGKPLDEYIYQESKRMVDAYGNHPSFCMMTYGNEPAGKKSGQYLATFVNYWKKTDPRRLYTSGAGWPVISENDFNSTADPRIQGWGEGLKSIINYKSPQSNYDWAGKITNWKNPTVSHEIGQWCVFPDFKEIKKYTGVLKANNFEIFKDQLQRNGLTSLADSFLWASGKLQALCYKADIEAALRTPGFGGFQLLGLNDFPGQGTALVGVLNAFWEEKGYVTAKEYSSFCNATVPLVRFSKMIFLNNEMLTLPVEIAHFGKATINNTTPSWSIKDTSGKVLFHGQLGKTSIPPGNGIVLGEIKQALYTVTQPCKLILTVEIASNQNSWEFFVYPALLPKVKQDVLVTCQLDSQALQVLANGGKVLLTLKKGSIKNIYGGDIEIGFSSIFWNTAWTNRQAPHTLGILVDPHHPAFGNFPTDYYSNWQWWDAMSHSNTILFDSIGKGIQPIVRVIDDWVTSRSLGLLFECRVDNGNLLVSGIDLITDNDKRPEAKQLMYSLLNYMNGINFNPVGEVKASEIMKIFVSR